MDWEPAIWPVGQMYCARSSLNLEEAPSSERIVELQTNIDDLSPEILGAVQDRLFQAGALDVFFTPIQMKKSRPATMLSVLCEPSAFEKMQEIIFAETSTFGIRYREMNRKTLDRELVEVKTSAGQIQVKIGRHAGKILQVAPEFESCYAAAQRSQLTFEAGLSARGRSILEFLICVRDEYFSPPRKSS